ncbi:MAG: hypothetical protein ABIR83_15245 [Nakamurella sp.]
MGDVRIGPAGGSARVRKASMLLRRLAAATFVTAAVALSSLGTTQAAHADPVVSGTACGVNEGVTVVVDFAPARDEVALGCAAGAQDTIGAAMAAAGFDITTEITGFGPYLCAIDGVAANPGNCQAFPGAYWSPWLATVDGTPGGVPSMSWTSAQVGVSGGPVAVGSVVGFDQNTDGAFPGTPPRLDLTALPLRDNTPVAVPAYGPGAGSATAVAGWLGRQLDAGNGLINGSPGLTIDAVYALAAAGVGGDTIDRSAAALLAAGSAYSGTQAEVAAKFAQVAKLALALQIAGVDPTTVPDGAGGTRDLLTDLRSTLNADGSFGTSDDPFRHAYALLALSRTEAGAPASAVSWLAAQQCTDASAAGSFGFGGCAGADADYTAVAVEGLLAAGVDAGGPTVSAATAWLTTQQSSAGDLAGNTNSTGLVGNVFAATGATGAAAAAAGFIGGLQVSCDTLAGDTALTTDALGAIAWTPAGLADATAFGLDAGNLGEWQYASVQAVLGLGAVTLGELTDAGAANDLPAAATCEAPVTDSSATSVDPTSVTPVEPAAVTPITSAVVVAGSTSRTTTTTEATPALASTGVTDRTGTEVAIAVLLLVTGGALVAAGRRAPSTRRHG